MRPTSFVFVALVTSAVAFPNNPQLENRQVDSVFNSITSAAASVVTGDGGSLFSAATSDIAGAAQTITSHVGGSVQTIVSVGGQAITLAASGAGVATSTLGSFYTVATGLAGSAVNNATSNANAAPANLRFPTTPLLAGLTTVIGGVFLGAMVAL